MPPRERSSDGRVTIQLAESGKAVIEKVVTQLHELALPIAKRCKLIQDLGLVDGSRAELPFRYSVVKGWDTFTNSDFQEPADPSVDELAEWLQVRPALAGCTGGTHGAWACEAWGPACCSVASARHAGKSACARRWRHS